LCVLFVAFNVFARCVKLFGFHAARVYTIIKITSVVDGTRLSLIVGVAGCAWLTHA